VIAAFAAVVATASCDHAARPTSSTSIGADGLRTYESITNLPDGSRVGCALTLAEDPVAGVLAGDREARAPVWLEHDGRHLPVIWPGRFSVAFGPEAILRNETGAVVARAGDQVELVQLERAAAAGTYEDPYIASCEVFGTQYVYLAPDHWEGDRRRPPDQI
jgi:hypothetical protein